MAQPLVDLATLDLSRDVVPDEELRALLPHRHEFALVDGIRHFDPERGVVVGYKDWDSNPWWARGHIPGRPLMPGVLMVEGAAQVSALLMKRRGGWDPGRFIGLAGLEGVRFRGTIVPPARVWFVAAVGSQSTRIARYPAQCLHEGKLVMEMELLGVPM